MFPCLSVVTFSYRSLWRTLSFQIAHSAVQEWRAAEIHRREFCRTGPGPSRRSKTRWQRWRRRKGWRFQLSACKMVEPWLSLSNSVNNKYCVSLVKRKGKRNLTLILKIEYLSSMIWDSMRMRSQRFMLLSDLLNILTVNSSECFS